MPYKSVKQAKYMHWAQENGKLSKSVDLNEWDKATDFKHLPAEKKPRFKKLKKLVGS